MQWIQVEYSLSSAMRAYNNSLFVDLSHRVIEDALNMVEPRQHFVSLRLDWLLVKIKLSIPNISSRSTQLARKCLHVKRFRGTTPGAAWR